MKRRIAILGSTGSIGTQTLEVIESLPDFFEVEVLTAYSNADLLIEQAKRFQPNAVVIVNENHYHKVQDALMSEDIKVFTGEKSLEDIVEMSSIDIVLNSLVGFSGLKPTVNAIRHNKILALANKETLVVAGEIITKLAKEHNVPILPVDSEHSAIFQCLQGESQNSVERLILTASGGPFRGKDSAFLETVLPEQAMQHPTWSMGAKVTIDSATLLNKGLEIIEAKFLFNVDYNQIDVQIHPQSIIHSMVQFKDGSIKAQMGMPSMKLPIQYALTYPCRMENTLRRFDFKQYASLTFEPVNHSVFPCLNIAYEAGKKCGNAPCIMNAANEIAVHAFLNKYISYTQIPILIEKALIQMPYILHPTMDDLIQSDVATRVFIKNELKIKN